VINGQTDGPLFVETSVAKALAVLVIRAKINLSNDCMYVSHKFGLTTKRSSSNSTTVVTKLRMIIIMITKARITISVEKRLN